MKRERPSKLTVLTTNVEKKNLVYVKINRNTLLKPAVNANLIKNAARVVAHSIFHGIGEEMLWCPATSRKIALLLLIMLKKECMTQTHLVRQFVSLAE